MLNNKIIPWNCPKISFLSPIWCCFIGGITVLVTCCAGRGGPGTSIIYKINYLILPQICGILFADKALDGPGGGENLRIVLGVIRSNQNKKNTNICIFESPCDLFIRFTLFMYLVNIIKQIQSLLEVMFIRLCIMFPDM